MAINNLFLLAALLTTPSFYELIPAGKDAFLFRNEARPSLQVVTVAPSGSIDVGDKIPLRLDDRVFKETRQTPSGEGFFPTMRLLGAGKDVFFFATRPRSILRVRLTGGRERSSFPLLFPNGPMRIYDTGNRWVVSTDLPTRLRCESSCECAFFHFFDRDWQPSGCVGQGKSFLEGPMKGDFSIATWWPERGRGFIYYNSSGDLFEVEADGRESRARPTVLEASFSGRTYRDLTVHRDRPALMTWSSESARFFVLEDDLWQEKGTWKGNWKAALPLEEVLILVNARGEIETRPIDSD